MEIAYVIVGLFVALVASGCALFGAGTGMKPATPRNPLCDLMDEVTEKAENFSKK